MPAVIVEINPEKVRDRVMRAQRVVLGLLGSNFLALGCSSYGLSPREYGSATFTNLVYSLYQEPHGLPRRRCPFP